MVNTYLLCVTPVPLYNIAVAVVGEKVESVQVAKTVHLELTVFAIKYNQFPSVLYLSHSVSNSWSIRFLTSTLISYVRLGIRS